MIETIFYFANSAAEYNQNKSELSARTISFVPNGDGTGKIYKNGVQYGGSDYELPAASSSVLGGIKTGYTTSGKNYAVQLDGNNRAFVNVPWAAGEGGSTTENPYDDSELRELISDLNTDLNTLANKIDEDAINTLKRTIDEYEKIMEEFGAGYNGGIPFGWNDDLRAFIQQVINTDADGNGATWSTLIQRADAIEARVQNVERNTTITVNGEETTLEALISNLHLYIDEATGTAIANLKTEWALTDEDLRAIKWLTSGFSSETTSTDSFAALYSRGQNDLSNAIATAKTEVIQQADGKYVAKSELASRVNEQLAGVYVRSDDQKALASLVANAGKDANGNATNAASIIVEAINNGTTSAKINADKIQLGGDTSVAGQLSVVNPNGKYVAKVLTDGTATFMNDTIKFKNADFPNSADYGANNGISIISPYSSNVNYQAFYQSHSIGFLDRQGHMHSGIWCGHSEYTNFLHLECGGAEIAIHNGPNDTINTPGVWMGNNDGSSNFTATIGGTLNANAITINGQPIGGSGLSGTYTLELLNGTATFTNGVLTAFTQHNNNLTLSLS